MNPPFLPVENGFPINRYRRTEKYFWEIWRARKQEAGVPGHQVRRDDGCSLAAAWPRHDTLAARQNGGRGRPVPPVQGQADVSVWFSRTGELPGGV